MSKRALEAAMKAYPPTYSRRKRYAKRVQSDRVDTHQAVRVLFQKGYEQAEEDLGWVSVKDRLPEVGHFVLTCVSDTGTPQCVGMAILLNDGTWWDGDMKVRVDYWMEVPKLKK